VLTFGFTGDGVIRADLGADGTSIAFFRYGNRRPGQQTIGDGVHGAHGCADSTLNTGGRIDGSEVVFLSNRVHRAGFFADTATCTPYLADLFNAGACVRGPAPDLDLVLFGFQIKDIPGAGNDTFITGSAFPRDYDRESVLSRDYGIKGADGFACPVPDTGI
jgi:hypothetical protein